MNRNDYYSGVWEIPRLQKALKTMRLTILLVLISAICVFAEGEGLQTYSASEASGIEISEQQQNTISGTVTDEEGLALIGVTVLVKGTTNGAITGTDGTYTLTNVPAGAILQFSFVGMLSQEVELSNQIIVNITLKKDYVGLEELVVIGYGSQSKKLVTGSVGSVDMEEANKNLPNVSIAQSLSRVAGIQFTGDGRPGQSGSILIRGQNSLSGGTQPLIVLDGIIYSGNFNEINPNDIASMEILKDASSTAIYGYRAANGVILITSKRGDTEKPTVSLNTFYGFQSPANRLELLSPERYLERRLDWRTQVGMEANPDNIADYISPTERENYLNGRSSNPWDEITQDGRISSTDLSVSGKTDRINYYLSSNFSNDKGLIYNDNQKRTTFRANVDVKLSDWFSVGMNSTFIHRDKSGREANIFDAYRCSPYGTFYHPDGEPTSFPVPDETAATNPMLSSILTTNENKIDNLFSNFYGKISVPVPKGLLTYRMNYSPNLRWDHNYNYQRQNTHESWNNTSASKSYNNYSDWVLENIFTYKQNLGLDHAFDITFMYGRTHTEYESTFANTGPLSLDGLGYNNLGLGTTPSNSSDALMTDDVSYMGRLNYHIKSKYLITLTARRDGSSVFAENNKYATFPSGAFAWIMSDESFMDNAAFIDFLKLRLSYGAVGNQAIAPYQSLSFSDTERYVFGNGGASSIGVVTDKLGNPNLKWETTYTSNAGIDFNAFNNRIGGTIEVYNSKTNDLLVRRSIPVMGGFDNILTNIGEVNNKGIEVTLNTVNTQKNKFEWTSSITCSYNKNEIVHLFETDLNNDGREDDDVSNSWFIGHPIASYYDYVFDGIYQEGDTDIPEGMEPGYVRVKDITGDGALNSEDREIVGSGNPKYVLNLGNNFKYGNFSMSIYLNSILGYEAIFNLINPLVPGRALNQVDTGWWTSENQSNTRPSLTYTNPLNTNWYVKRDFLRIRDISFAYEFDSKTLEKLSISSLRLFISAKNVYTFTNWLGSDPENGGDYTDHQGTSDLYPMPRTISLGLNVTL
jgi:TonB-linked SusC/RagA family outer membrane protein